MLFTWWFVWLLFVRTVVFWYLFCLWQALKFLGQASVMSVQHPSLMPGQDRWRACCWSAAERKYRGCHMNLPLCCASKFLFKTGCLSALGFCIISGFECWRYLHMFHCTMSLDTELHYQTCLDLLVTLTLRFYLCRRGAKGRPETWWRCWSPASL